MQTPVEQRPRPRLAAPRASVAVLALAAAALLAAPAHAAGDVTVTVLHKFTAAAGNATTAGSGANPWAVPVYKAADHRIYGTTGGYGATAGTGVLWSLDPAVGDSSFKTVNSGKAARHNAVRVHAASGDVVLGATTSNAFSFLDGVVDAGTNPAAVTTFAQPTLSRGLWSADSAGNVYMLGTDSSVPRIYRWLASSESVETLASSFATYNYPHAIIVSKSSDAQLYGVIGPGLNADTSELTGSFVYAYDPATGAHEILASFDATTGYPHVALTGLPEYAGLADGGDGWLYGSTYTSAAALSGLDYKGTVYRVSKTKDGSGQYALEVLHGFTGTDGDGLGAAGPLVLAADGNIYGTTMRGGTGGYGTLWRVVLGGTAPVYEVLHSFALAEGSRPMGLAAGEDYVLYGAARAGGLQAADAATGGTVFQVAIAKPAGSFATALTADKTSITLGESVVLSWLAEHVQDGSCSASGAWSGSKPADSADAGSADKTVTPAAAGTQTFTLACTGIDGGSVSSSVDVTVQQASSGGGTGDGGGSGGGSPTAAPLGGGGGGSLGAGLFAPLAALLGLRRRRRT